MRALAAVAAFLGAVAFLRWQLGPWATALVIMPVLVALVIAGWALLDRRLFEPPPLPVRRYERPVDARVIDR